MTEWGGLAILASSRQLTYELGPGRSAWIHLVQGEMSVGDLVLLTGDGVGVRSEPRIVLAARAESELLLIDVPDRRPAPPTPA
jgi:redox-sensitive bicupin YhaK (pirin superfamily)